MRINNVANACQYVINAQLSNFSKEQVLCQLYIALSDNKYNLINFTKQIITLHK